MPVEGRASPGAHAAHPGQTSHAEVRLLDDSGVSWARRCSCGDRWPCEEAVDLRALPQRPDGRAETA